MKTATLLAVVTICGLSMTAHAQWSKETQSITSQSNRMQSAVVGAMLSNPLTSTLVKLKGNGCYNMIEGSAKGVLQTNAVAVDELIQDFKITEMNFSDLDFNKIDMFIRFPNHRNIRLSVGAQYFKFRNGTFDTYYWEPTKNAPEHGKKLAVYLPGIFQDGDQFFTYQAVSLMVENGFTVLVIPNSMSSDYLSQKPVHSMGSFEAEANVVLNAIRSFKARVPNVTSVDLLGASYGGYLAAVTAALDAQSKNPVIDKQTTLIGPIYSMKVAADYLDPLMDITLPLKATIEKEVNDGITWETFVRNAKIVPELGPCKAIGLMFHESLKVLLMQTKRNYLSDQEDNFYNRNYQNITKEEFDKVNAYDDEYMKSVRFNSLIANITPENKAYYESEKDNLAYWIHLSAAHHNKRIRIVTGSNDFLSPKKLFSYLPDWAKSNDHLQFTVMGGHNGFIFDSWFRKFVEAAYRR